ncbi:hypothetical protein WME89_20860 [Sorangium sp. So ce321]|uniref:hypothetical protein n=1 Tax=Sorangium sp. So ce321 TaxID=3133300 RepID=UPI003F5E9357
MLLPLANGGPSAWEVADADQDYCTSAMVRGLGSSARCGAFAALFTTSGAPSRG